MKSLLSKISVTAFIIIYLFLCGSIYLISYWSTFGFDITNYINFIEVPQSFILPLALAFSISIALLILLFIFMAALTTILMKRESKLNNTLTEIFQWIILLILIFILYSFIANGKFVLNKVIVYLVLGAIIFNLFSSNKINNLFKDTGTKNLIGFLIILVPLIIYTVGKRQSSFVKENKKYFSVVDIGLKNDSTSQRNIIGKKVIGKLGDFMFLSDTSNSDLYILRMDEVKFIKLKETGNNISWFTFKPLLP